MYKMTPALVTAAGLLLGFFAVISCTDRQELTKKDALDICGSCHGSTGISYKNYIPHLAGQNYEYLTNQLRQFRAVHEKGDVRANPTMEWHAIRIDEKDIDRLAQYYSEQTCAKGIFNWKEDDLKNVCTTCHGPYGRSSDPNIPNLAGQKVSYMRNQLIAFQNSAKGNPNKNPHIQRSSGRMGQPVENMPDDAMSALYYFNAKGCR